MIIAGIGSRKVPQSISDEMIRVGEWCRENKIYINSGHSIGSDWAFEQGSQDYCVVYLPWVGFNKHLISKAIIKCIDIPETHILAAKFHPAFSRLSFGAKKLIARNGYQVLGEKLDTPVNAIVCFTSDGTIKGGTGQALRIAGKYNIPVFNMFFEKYNMAEKVINELKGFRS